MGNRLKFYGWGFENTGLTEGEREHLFHFVAACLGVEPRARAAAAGSRHRACVRRASRRPPRSQAS